MKKLAIVVAWWGLSICSPAHAKTFVGVLWPLFGAGAAPGLVEFVAELKTMPDVEVSTYPHESWASLADEIARQPPGTHTVVIGYSLGANNAVRVANQSKYIDLIIALQPSMLTTTPAFTGNVGRMVEFYNPNPWMTFGGMGSQKLVGKNIEYVANNDTHIGAPFNSDFRNFARSEIARFAADNSPAPAQAEIPKPLKLAQPAHSAGLKTADEGTAPRQRDLAAKDHYRVAQIEIPKAQKPVTPERVAAEPPKQQPHELALSPVGYSSFTDLKDTSVQRQLTIEDMEEYVRRTYSAPPPAGFADSRL